MAAFTSQGIHDAGWRRFGYHFNTPEAWGRNGNHRALGYSRALAVWALLAEPCVSPDKTQDGPKESLSSRSPSLPPPSSSSSSPCVVGHVEVEALGIQADMPQTPGEYSRDTMVSFTTCSDIESTLLNEE